MIQKLPENTLPDFLVIFFAGLGLSTYDPTQVLGGFIIALAMSILAKRLLEAQIVKQAKPLGWTATILAGLLAALMGAIGFSHWAPEIPVQFVMGAFGFVSSFLLPMILKIMARLSNRSGDIADGALDRITKKGNQK